MVLRKGLLGQKAVRIDAADARDLEAGWTDEITHEAASIASVGGRTDRRR